MMRREPCPCPCPPNPNPARHDTSLIDRFDAELSGHFQVIANLGLGHQVRVRVMSVRMSNPCPS